MGKLKIERNMTREQVYSVRRQARILMSAVFGFSAKHYYHKHKNQTILGDFSFSEDVVFGAIDIDLFEANHYPTYLWDIAGCLKKYGQIETAVKSNMLLPKNYYRSL